MSEHCNVRRVDRMADIFLACLLGALAAAAGLHWFSSCSELLVCGLTAITPTRPSMWQRALRVLHELRLQSLIRSYENEAAAWRKVSELAPVKITHCANRIAALRAELVGRAGGNARILTRGTAQ